jgi:chorismate mutase
VTTTQPDNSDDFDLDGARSHMDEIDGAICDLIDRRRALSQSIQKARMSRGDSRISHARENQVVSSYSDRLGKPGTAISLAILELCRGHATA